MVGVANYLIRGCSLLRRLEQDQSKCLIYGIAGYRLLGGGGGGGLNIHIEVYGNTIRTFRIVCYIAGVR